jgi:endonuclease/exonuclease/phosphatase family metal-dependent hydrolase
MWAVRCCFHPGILQVGQLRLLVKRLQELVSERLPEQHQQLVPALVMGDMNHQPDTPVYHFLRHGWVDCLRQHRKDMSGEWLEQDLLLAC